MSGVRQPLTSRQEQPLPAEQRPTQSATEAGSELQSKQPAGQVPPLSRRAMTVHDIEPVLRVEASAYGFPWSRGNFIDSLAAGYLAELLDGGGAFGVIGYFVAMPGVDELHLLNVTVAPPWQGRGLGTALLDAVTELARVRRLPALWLEVRQSNGRARALYRRRGFVEVGLRRAYYPAVAQREDAVVMRLAVPALPGADDGLD